MSIGSATCSRFAPTGNAVRPGYGRPSIISMVVGQRGSKRSWLRTPTFSSSPEVPRSQKLIPGSLFEPDRPFRPGVCTEDRPFTGSASVAVPDGVADRQEAATATVNPFEMPAVSTQPDERLERIGTAVELDPEFEPVAAADHNEVVHPGLCEHVAQRRGHVVAELAQRHRQWPGGTHAMRPEHRHLGRPAAPLGQAKTPRDPVAPLAEPEPDHVAVQRRHRRRQTAVDAIALQQASESLQTGTHRREANGQMGPARRGSAAEFGGRQITGGRPSRVRRHTPRHEIGARSTSIPQPRRQPRRYARRVAPAGARQAPSTSHATTWTAATGHGSVRRAISTRLRPVNSHPSACRSMLVRGWNTSTSAR